MATFSGKSAAQMNPAALMSSARSFMTTPRHAHAVAVALADRIAQILEYYQEQATLLDPYLPELTALLTTPLLDHAYAVLEGRDAAGASARGDTGGGEQAAKKPKRAATSRFIPLERARLIFDAVYCLIKVRGYKTIVRFLSHEPHDLEPLFAYLQTPGMSWRGAYTLYLWLSIVALTPFDLHLIDSRRYAPQSLSEALISSAEAALARPSTESAGAAVFLGRLLTRRDIGEEADRYLQRTVALLLTMDLEMDSHHAQARLWSLCHIYHHGPRAWLLRQNPVVLALLPLLDRVKSVAILRKLILKLMTRVALAALPPRVAAWRYHRGQRSLNVGPRPATTAAAVAATTPALTPTVTEEEAEFTNSAIPDYLEDMLGSLLMGLEDEATIVRWTCAKGIGHLCNRLELAMANDAIDAIVALLGASGDTDAAAIAEVNRTQRFGSETAWHGACLALAELGRRGLLLPARLPTLRPLILRAFRMDLRRGTRIVGAQVRDAASYVVWAFARAFAPDVLAPFLLGDVVAQLAVTSLLDRDVGIRRAASAAFQENTGRQGQIPHGIEIMTLADFFAVGNRRNCYLHIVPQVVRFAPYYDAFVNDVLHVRLVHWDPAIRDLGAQCLARIVTQLPNPALTTQLFALLLRRLRPSGGMRSFNTEAEAVHGALLALGNVAARVPVATLFADLPHEASRRTMEACVDVIATEFVAWTRVYHGHPLLIAAYAAMSQLAAAGWPLPADASWLDAVHLGLDVAEADVQAAAAQTFGQLARHGDPARMAAAVDAILRHVSDDADRDVGVSLQRRKGLMMALACLPAPAIAAHAAPLFNALVVLALPKTTPMPLASLPALETPAAPVTFCAPNDRDMSLRQLAIQSLDQLIQTLLRETTATSAGGDDASSSSSTPPPHTTAVAFATETYDAVLAMLLLNMEDYTIDSRGDIGSILREAAMTLALAWVDWAAQHDAVANRASSTAVAPVLTTARMTALVGALLQHGFEKINRTRGRAAHVLLTLLLRHPPLPIPFLDRLLHAYRPGITPVTASLASGPASASAGQAPPDPSHSDGDDDGDDDDEAEASDEGGVVREHSADAVATKTSARGKAAGKTSGQAPRKAPGSVTATPHTWTNDTQAFFGRLLPLLALPPYQYRLFLGLTACLGSKSESMQTDLATALADHLARLPAEVIGGPDAVKAIDEPASSTPTPADEDSATAATARGRPTAPPAVRTALPPVPSPETGSEAGPDTEPLSLLRMLVLGCRVLDDCRGLDRFTVPVLDVMALVLSTLVARDVAVAEPEGEGDAAATTATATAITDAAGLAPALATLYDHVRRETMRSRAMDKLQAGMRLVVLFLAVGAARLRWRRRALAQLVMWLGHPFPVMRRQAAEALYMALLTVPLDPGPAPEASAASPPPPVGDAYLASLPGRDHAQTLCLDIDWSRSLDDAKVARQRVATCLGVQLPAAAQVAV